MNSESVGKTAGMIVDYGVMVVICAILLAGAAAFLFLYWRHWNRKLNDQYIHKDKVLDYIRQYHSDILKLSWDKLPNLREHPFFMACTKGIRWADSLNVKERDGSIHTLKSILAKDLLSWHLRAFREVFLALLSAAYEHKDGLEKCLGNHQEFCAIVDGQLTAVNSALKHRLVEEFNYPNHVFDLYQEMKLESDRVLSELLIFIASSYNENYWRLKAFLDILYTRVSIMRSQTVDFIKGLDKEIATVDYKDRPNEADHQTMPSFNSNIDNYPGRVFETGYRPKIW